MQLNLPNKLTLSRVLMIPVYVTLMYVPASWAMLAAGAVFILASLTDTADGYIARKNNLVTDFGKFADPLADKVLVLSAIVMFAVGGTLTGWSLIIVIFRELTVTGFRCIAAAKNRVLAADAYGKLKTITQLVSISALHFTEIIPFLNIPALALYYISIVLTVFSGANYLVKNRDILKEDDKEANN